MILSNKTEDIIYDSQNFEDIFDFSNLDENHELFSNKNRKLICKFKIETPKNFWIDEFACLKSKVYSFKCKDNIESKTKIKRISKYESKHISFEEFKKCSNGKENQRVCNNQFLRSINHEMHLQEIEKSTLSIFDDKRCYKNETESKPWN